MCVFVPAFRLDRDHQVRQTRPHRPGDVQEDEETAGRREEEEAGRRRREPAQRHGQHVRQRLVDSMLLPRQPR